MIISIHQNNLLNPSDIYESYNTVIADEFNVPYFFATNEETQNCYEEN